MTPATLSFNYQAGGPAPGSQPLSVTSSGASVNFTASPSTASGGNWLQVSPGSGTTPASPTVSVDPAALAAGTFTGSITVQAPQASGSPQTVTVTLTVTDRPRLSVTPAALTFNYQAGGPVPASQPLSITSSGASVNFTASPSTTSGGNWLRVSPGSGTTPASPTVSVDPASIAAGTYTGSITVQAPDASGSPQTVAVTLTVTDRPR